MEDEKIDQPTKKRSLKTRYIKTRLIKSLDELASQEFVYFNGKLVHRGWFLNWRSLNIPEPSGGSQIGYLATYQSTKFTVNPFLAAELCFLRKNLRALKP